MCRIGSTWEVLPHVFVNSLYTRIFWISDKRV